MRLFGGLGGKRLTAAVRARIQALAARRTSGDQAHQGWQVGEQLARVRHGFVAAMVANGDEPRNCLFPPVRIACREVELFGNVVARLNEQPLANVHPDQTDGHVRAVCRKMLTHLAGVAQAIGGDGTLPRPAHHFIRGGLFTRRGTRNLRVRFFLISPHTVDPDQDEPAEVDPPDLDQFDRGAQLAGAQNGSDARGAIVRLHA